MIGEYQYCPMLRMGLLAIILTFKPTVTGLPLFSKLNLDENCPWATVNIFIRSSRTGFDSLIKLSMESQTCPCATLKRNLIFNESDRAALISDKYSHGYFNDNQCCPTWTRTRNLASKGQCDTISPPGIDPSWFVRHCPNLPINFVKKTCVLEIQDRIGWNLTLFLSRTRLKPLFESLPEIQR